AQRLERDRHGPLPGAAAEHAEVQAGEAGRPGGGEEVEEQLVLGAGGSRCWRSRRIVMRCRQVLPGAAGAPTVPPVAPSAPVGPRQHPSALFCSSYLRGSTASLSAFWIRALTTVLAGILIASPVAGLRPMRALRFWTTSLTM